MDNSTNTLTAVSPEEAVFLFSGDKEHDEKSGCIGHLRADFGSGQQFFSTFFNHVAELRSPAFAAELDALINGLRESGPLKSFNAMTEYCYRNKDAFLPEGFSRGAYGFKSETDSHSFYLRLAPQKGDYNLYCYIYKRELLEQAKSEIEQPKKSLLGHLNESKIKAAAQETTPTSTKKTGMEL